MSEHQPPSPEKKLSAQEQDWLEQERLFMEDYPAPEVGALSPEQCAEKIREFEALCDAFEQTHNLDVLNAIEIHTAEEAYANPVREAAKKDLPAIVSLIDFLKRQPQIPRDTYEKLRLRYSTIDAAIGNFNDDWSFDHSIR